MEDAPKTRTQLAIFCAVMLVALAWAFTTKHVWEDYYITYRSSRNLAVGNGLVFNVGDRLHTFTSPLGVLLPAAAFELTGKSSDSGAIWIFRVWSAAALAGAVLLMLAVARRFRYAPFAAGLLAVFFALDGKTLDFTTNGMETGFLLLFIAYTLWAMFVSEKRRWLHLGLAWGGLMWTRPDSFLYIGFLAAGVFFFNGPERTGMTRGQWFKLFLRAGAVCTVVYLPWLEWATWYYGTPVPHTITAKGGVVTDPHTLGGLVKALVSLPVAVWRGATSLEGTYLPSYYQIGGWPAAMVTGARAVALFLAFQWVIPWWRVEVRAASFAFCGMHVYLTYFPFFPFPWYLPGTTFLAAVTLGGMLAQLWAAAEKEKPAADSARRRGWLKPLVIIVAVIAVSGQGWLTWQMQREMTAEQIYSANGTRKKVGKWLRAHSQPGQTVFMEPLGHIGYFSGLKTYDFPGLSSRETVEAIRAVGTNWGFLIEYLSPDWLVLRPPEFDRVKDTIPWMFGDDGAYEFVEDFNNLPAIEALDIYGRGYVAFDAHLSVFRRRIPKLNRLDAEVSTSLAKLDRPVASVEGHPLFQTLPVQSMSVRVPAGAKHVWIMFGIPAEAYRGRPADEGVEFIVQYSDGRHTERMLVRRLKPQMRIGDRAIQVVDAKLPPNDGKAVISLLTVTNTAHAEWSYWGEPEFIK